MTINIFKGTRVLSGGFGLIRELLLMHGLKPFQCLARPQKVVLILDFVTVTLISNEGSSLALHSPLIAEQP